MTTREDSSTYKFLPDHPNLSHLLKEAEMNKERAEELKDIKSYGVLLRLDSVQDNAKSFQYYTGLMYDVLIALFRYLEPKATRDMKCPNGSRTVLFDHNASRNKPKTKQKETGKARTTRRDHEPFYTSVKIRLGLQNVDLAEQFGITPNNWSLIFTAWGAIFLHQN